VAERLQILVKQILLPDEDHVRKIWDRDLVLIRPDSHVARRCAANEADVPPGDAEIEMVLLVAVGQQSAPNYCRAHSRQTLENSEAITISGLPKDRTPFIPGKFAATVGNVEQDAGKIEKMATFQT
jgi:hypothetical protein